MRGGDSSTATRSVVSTQVSLEAFSVKGGAPPDPGRGGEESSHNADSDDTIAMYNNFIVLVFLPSLDLDVIDFSDHFCRLPLLLLTIHPLGHL